jgi:hypothetical protein
MSAKSTGRKGKKREAAIDAIRAINRQGCLLVFPIDNRKEFASIWSEFYPRTPMRWEWDEDGDDRVARLWHLRAELSTCNDVIYTKWFRGRATFFSRPVFTALLRLLGNSELGLSREAKLILETLKLDSPLSTKQLKRATDLQGRFNEAAYQRALKELFSRMLIVGYGEVDDGAFPSLAIGATQNIFEELWTESRELSREEALKRLPLKSEQPWLKHYVNYYMRLEGALPKLGAAISGPSRAKHDMESVEY